MNSANNILTIEDFRQINSTIYKLYDETLSFESCMDLFMEELENQIYYDRRDFIFFSYNPTMEIYEIQSFFPDNWKNIDINNYIGTYIHMDDVLPILADPREVVFRNNDIFSSNRQYTQYYQEFVQTAKLGTSIDANIPLHDSLNLFASFALYRDPEKKEFSERDVEIIKLYQKHLSRIFTRFLVEKKQTGKCEELIPFDNFSSLGICIVRFDLEFISYNTSFKKFAVATSTSIQDSLVGHHVKKIVKQLIANPTETKQESVFTDSNDVTFLIEASHYSEDCSKFICLITPLSKLMSIRLESLKENYNLSNREYEILCFIIKKGLSNEEIAEELFISPTTVKRHISNVYQKLGINSQKQLFPLLNIL